VAKNEQTNNGLCLQLPAVPTEEGCLTLTLWTPNPYYIGLRGYSTGGQYVNAISLGG